MFYKAEMRIYALIRRQTHHNAFAFRIKQENSVTELRSVHA